MKNASVAHPILEDEPGTAASRSDVSWIPVAIVLALVAALFFANLGARVLWSSEGRWAEIAREMRLNANYFWPTINGKLYYDKPLLTYWFVVGASYLTGGVNEAASRLPCAISALIAVVLTMAIAARLYSRFIAVASSLILATSYSFVFFARHASADMETVAGMMAALALFVFNRDRPRGWWLVPFWLVMAVTSLTKGLLGFALPLVILGSFSMLRDGWLSLTALRNGSLRARIAWIQDRFDWLLNWKSFFAIGISLSVYILPFSVSSQRMHSNAGLYFVFRENILRFFRPFDHRGAIFMYFYVIFALMAPWSVFLPAALVSAHSNQSDPQSKRSNRFVKVAFWATFIFFTLSGSRRSYYLLPILPFGALLVARVFCDDFNHPRPARILTRFGFYLVSAVLLIGLTTALLPPHFRPGRLALYPPTPDLPLLIALLVPAVVLCAMALIQPDSRRLRFRALVAVAFGFMFYLYVFALPAADEFRGERPFAEGVRETLHGDLSHLVIYKIWGPGLVFYLGNSAPIPAYDSADELTKDSNARWIIALERDLSSLPQNGRTVLHELVFPWEDSAGHRSKYVLVEFSQAKR